MIGGGASGLLAAHRLLELDCEVHLFESHAIGGMLQTVRRGGWVVEAGAHTIAEPEAPVRTLLKAAGVTERSVRVAPEVRRRFVVHHGVPIAVPLSPGELVASPLLSVRGRLRLLKEPFLAPGPVNDDESVDAFARRRFGSEVAMRMIEPIVASSTGGDVTQLLARVLFPAHVAYERDGGSVLRGAMRAGMQARRRASTERHRGPWTGATGAGDVATQLAAALGPERCVAAAVDRVSLMAPGVAVGSGEQRHRYDAAVIAVPLPALDRITIDGIDAGLFSLITGMPLASVVTVTLGYRRTAVQHALDGSGMLVPASERRHVLVTAFPATMFSGRAPADHVLLTSMAGGVRHRDLVSADDGDLRAVVRREMEHLLGAKGEPVFTEITRWHDALPQPVAGHAARLQAADDVESAHPAIAFAGAWRDGSSVADAMRGGVRAAERVAARLVRN